MTRTLGLPPPDANDVDLGSGTIFSVGTVTAVIWYAAVTVLTHLNCLYCDDHVHLGYGRRQSGIVST